MPRSASPAPPHEPLSQSLLGEVVDPSHAELGVAEVEVRPPASRDLVHLGEDRPHRSSAALAIHDLPQAIPHPLFASGGGRHARAPFSTIGVADLPEREPQELESLPDGVGESGLFLVESQGEPLADGPRGREGPRPAVQSVSRLYGLTGVTARRTARRHTPRPSRGRRLNPMYSNAPVARTRPIGRYTLNRQLA